jgi:amino acid transporter/nucleotide-binding universal stress UspA family protein
MATTPAAPGPPASPGRRAWGAAKVIIVGSVMFTFISYWKTAAVVLCDLASTAFYIGGIVEQAIGPAAPWFILGVMLFSYAVRSVYIESCSLFVRGGVYKVVKEAMGGTLAKISVSALMFDYILTGPISGASAGQYLIGLVLESLQIFDPSLRISDEGTKKLVRNWGSVAIAGAITLYFGYKNLIGIHESSDKAFKIMIATTIMAVVMLLWCVITLIVRGGPVNPIVAAPDLSQKVQYQDATGYKLTASGIQALDKLPAVEREKLKALIDKPFRNEADFHSAVRAVLGWQGKLTPGQEAVLAAIANQAKLIKWYKITDSTLDNLRWDAAVSDKAAPVEILEKLEPIKSIEFKTAADLDARLAKLGVPREYRPHIIDEAAVPEAFDPITGEQKPMWEVDPKTGGLVPATDINGNPRPKIDEVTKRPENPLGFLRDTRLAQTDWSHINWFTWVGILGLMIAFGHSILAMSGEETLAQVYREVQSPKLPNFKKAAFIVFVYSVLFTASISFLAVWLIPDAVRMRDYSDNLIGGLAMYVVGQPWMRLLLNGFVVVVGFLILAGAVNTAIIGSNGVLNRVAEDGVLPDWFLRPHPRYGTTYRLLFLIVGLQIGVLLVSQGDMLLLGEAYAFGVVWSFVFKALAMVVLRFKDKSPREFKVPLNIRVGSVELPIGLFAIFLVLLTTAILNFLTKEVATVSGVIFTLVFLVTFVISERAHERRRQGKHHEHLEQFNRETAEEISPAGLGLKKPYRKLVAIRSPQNLYMLEKALAETDPETTDVVVMTAKTAPAGDSAQNGPELDNYDQHLMTAVVDRAEKAGKQVKPLIVPTNNPLFAVIRTARDLGAQELVMGASNKYTADEQLEQIGFYWLSMQEGEPRPLTVRILGQGRDVYLDLNGGSRIPKISERKARSVAELRSAGVGVDRVLLIHEGDPASRDLYQAVLTMMDPQVPLTLVPVNPNGQDLAPDWGKLQSEREQAKQLGREIQVQPLPGDFGQDVVRLAKEGQYDLIIVPLPAELPAAPNLPLHPGVNYILHHAHCRVFLAAAPTVPQETGD